ncbi:MAG: CHAT domain-containing protein, partial [Chitinophagales bacterium]|nr:CHAT domain-containing protein [Chitinophagales bacterium]
VPDKETAALMELFYKQLKKGKRNAVALADAKREFIQKYPLKNHPYFWAGFVLNGANDAVYPVNYGFAFFMAVGLLTILFLWYYRKLI